LMNSDGEWRTAGSYDAEGFVDLVLVRPGRDEGRVIFAEVKGKAEKVSLKQLEWQDVLKAAGAEVYVWRVGEMDLEGIMNILK
jgi:hypothetical protein